MKKAGLYVRVSTSEQRENGMSVDTQISALLTYCEQHDLIPYRIFNDAGISARKSYKRRPALLSMLQACQDHEVDIVLFTRLDRFFRSVPDYYACVSQMDNVPWKAILEDYETETPDGVFKVNIMLSVAQSEADKTSARLKDAFAYKRARGDYVGKAPLGYVVRGRDLLLDPEKKDGVAAMFKAYLSSFSSKKAMDAAADHGIKIERTTFLKMINNPAYYGQTNSGYLCDPYITKEEWQMIQEVKRSRTRKKIYGDQVYLFSGLCKCGYCGQRMPSKVVPRTHADGTKVLFKKYLCSARNGTARSCPHLQIVETRLEKYLLQNLDDMLHDLTVEAVVERKGISDNLKKKKRLEGKLERLKELFIDGDIDKADYQTRKKNLELEIASIHIPRDTLPTLPANWLDIYQDLTEENRQVFWKKIIKEIVITNETKDHPEVVFR